MMVIRVLFWIGFTLCLGTHMQGQIAFGIVAADTITGEVGAAGGSCTHKFSPEGEAYVASSVIPGKAAFLTQGFYDDKNKENFNIQIEGGRGALSLMTWLISHDAGQSHEFRQYAVALFRNDKLELAAHSGTKNLPITAERFGPNFIVVGNTMLSEDIINRMVSGFLNTNGDLADKLLGALRGAKEIGADARCLDSLVSSKSAYIRVAKPSDDRDSLWLDINVSWTPHKVDAIDSLLNRFDEWRGALTSWRSLNNNSNWRFFPNPVHQRLYIDWNETPEPRRLRLINALGITIVDAPYTRQVDLSSFTDPLLFLTLQDQDGLWTPLKKVILKK